MSSCTGNEAGGTMNTTLRIKFGDRSNSRLWCRRVRSLVRDRFRPMLRAVTKLDCSDKPRRQMLRGFDYESHHLKRRKDFSPALVMMAFSAVWIIAPAVSARTLMVGPSQEL